MLSVCISCTHDVLDDTLQNHDRSHNFSVRKWLLDHNSEHCGHRSKQFHKHFISRDYKPILNEEMLKYLSNVFQKTDMF